MNKTVLKARYGSELRKNWIYHNNDVSLDDLISKMQRYFDIKELDGIKLKYRDEEDDWITLVDDNDLSFALSTLEILFIEVFLDKSKTTKEEKSSFDVKVSESNTDTTQKQLTGTKKQISIEQLTDIPLNNDQVPPTLHQNGGVHQQTPYAGGGPPIQQPSYVGGVMPPPVVSSFCPTPISQQVSGGHHQPHVGGVLPPPVSNYGPPHTMQQVGRPPSQQLGGIQQQPAYIGGALPPPQLSEQLTDIPLDAGHIPPTSQIGGMQHLSYTSGGVLPPVQQPSYVGGGVVPPPIVSNYGPLPNSQHMNLPQQMGLPPTSQQISGVHQPAYVGGALPPPPIVSSIGTHGTSANPFSRQVR
uniref:PB1 domain-containing protein n=1 Tax=Meloidogyne incognita TaxID=6306 RepID=A0A914MLN0_MELIC